MVLLHVCVFRVFELRTRACETWLLTLLARTFGPGKILDSMRSRLFYVSPGSSCLRWMFANACTLG